MSEKRLKDPLYGYVSIPTEIMSGVVDTAVFQRLRRITQTSYSPLYSSAVHNRFVHSLGVYHLGGIAVRTLKKEIENSPDGNVLSGVGIELERLEYVFLLACLLHDVGHAPFSHTGEMFYLENGKDYGLLHELLAETVGTEEFRRDIPSERSNSAAPHEIMSAIVGIREFGDLMLPPAEKEFFARCITGYCYSDDVNMGSLLNCFIRLLNSKVIDVDKLDYLIRDAYITGYCTVDIDYTRLLTSLTVIKDGDCYNLAYYKGAISVIEDVVYAHDSERKWIQNHPVILYECYILQHIMEMLGKKHDTEGKRLFSMESLSVEGQTFEDGTLVRLLSDDDIIHMAKRYYEENDIIEEYFERKRRRHPLWKSEAEYKAFFRAHVEGGELLDSLENAMEATAKYLSKNTTNWVINEDLAETLRRELESLDTAGLEQRTKAAQKKEKQDILNVVECLISYAKSVGYEGDFVLLQSSQFNSGFAKPDFSAIKIVFPAVPQSKVIRFGERVSSISGITSERQKFFYLCYKRTDGTADALDVNALRGQLFVKFMEQ